MKPYEKYIEDVMNGKDIPDTEALMMELVFYKRAAERFYEELTTKKRETIDGMYSQLNIFGES